MIKLADLNVYDVISYKKNASGRIGAKIIQSDEPLTKEEAEKLIKWLKERVPDIGFLEIRKHIPHDD